MASVRLRTFSLVKVLRCGLSPCRGQNEIPSLPPCDRGVKLEDATLLKRARIHPLAVLIQSAKKGFRGLVVGGRTR